MTKKQFNLSRERRKANLTQVGLSELAGVTESTVQNHEYHGASKLQEYGYKYIFEKIAKKNCLT